MHCVGTRLPSQLQSKAITACEGEILQKQDLMGHCDDISFPLLTYLFFSSTAVLLKLFTFP